MRWRLLQRLHGLAPILGKRASTLWICGWAALSPCVAGAATIDFSALPVGTKLESQIAPVTFAPGGVVVDSASGHLASFTASGCEFCASTAHISFAVLQRSVTVHLGLLATKPSVARDIRLAAFDASGATVASSTATLTTGSGFANALTVATATPTMAVITLQAINDPDLMAALAIHDLVLEDAPPGAVPDFLLEAQGGASVLQGAATSVPILIRRFGGSTGPISLSLSALASGVSGAVSPSPAPATSATLTLTAGDAPHSVQVLTITGNPTTPTAGSAPRSVAVIVESMLPLSLFGPAAIDFGTCAVSAANGTVVAKYTAVRDYRVSGPLQVTLEDVPSGVSGAAAPTTLTFGGGAIGEQIVITLGAVAGPSVPIVSIVLHVSGPGVDTRFPILIFGACPQQNRNFNIRGAFRVIDHFVDAPLVRAQVEFFRYRSDWFDDWVGSTFTDANGAFSQDLFASIDGDYYARLRLANVDLNLEDADNSSVWSIDTAHQSNASGLIDAGTTTIIRDNGAGSPRAGTWQAFRKDIEAFRSLNALPFVPGGFLGVIDYRGHITPLTFYDEVHWAHGFDSSGSTHEFGHVIRHSLDGDGNHWNLDNFQYLYGRSHTHCGQFGAANAGYGFNEGWADFWASDTGCCPADISNESIEGTVAHDLHNLSTCAGGKAGLVAVLARGQDIIHSDSEFRIQYARQFPACAIPPLNSGCVAGGGGGGGGCGTIAQERSAPPSEHSALTSDAIDYDITGMRRAIDALVARQQQATPVPATLLRAAIEDASLTLQRLIERKERSQTKQAHLAHGFEERLQRELLRSRRNEILRRALRQALAIPGAPRKDIERRLMLLQTTRVDDRSLTTPFARPNFDEDVAATRPRSPFPRWLSFVLPALVVLLLLLYWARRRRT